MTTDEKNYMNKCSPASREQTWKERGIEGKLEALRNALVPLIYRIDAMHEILEKLRFHEHSPLHGYVMTRINEQGLTHLSPRRRGNE